jgi:flagellin
MDAMSTEIDRIAGTTTWAGANLMEATTTSFSFQVGAATGTQNQISVTIDSMNTSGLLLNTGSSTIAAVTDISAAAGAGTTTAATTFEITAGSATQTGKITIGGGGASVEVDITAGMSQDEIGDAIVSAYNATSTTANADSGYLAAYSSGTVTFSKSDGTTVVTATVTNDKATAAEIPANTNFISVEDSTTDADDADDNALASIILIDAAIKKVNVQRSELGAVSNRLNHTVNNLTNISSNLSAAKGGIEDSDFALETTNLAKNQILQQASTAMLAQANASKQNVLSLLQG